MYSARQPPARRWFFYGDKLTMQPAVFRLILNINILLFINYLLTVNFLFPAWLRYTKITEER
ncbi:hypothetical protein GTPT_2841 [Tatumella ptyseos ATCC 33301]|uniref:Uncharacterized protein n=1 Tax=Tatumella ptyseos ATCC 33301 TaxID=1005995 RepID=A0A085JBF4_9GAMM|nr:hypothetical protein GTPT_2841 [Tatumella ptyseos ATCC 33301]